MKMNNSLEVYRTVALGSIRPNDNTHLHSFFNPEYDYADVTLMMKWIYDYADDILWSWLYEKGKVDKHPPGGVDGEGGGV